MTTASRSQRMGMGKGRMIGGRRQRAWQCGGWRSKLWMAGDRTTMSVCSSFLTSSFWVMPIAPWLCLSGTKHQLLSGDCSWCHPRDHSYFNSYRLASYLMTKSPATGITQIPPGGHVHLNPLFSGHADSRTCQSSHPPPTFLTKL